MHTPPNTPPDPHAAYAASCVSLHDELMALASSRGLGITELLIMAGAGQQIRLALEHEDPPMTGRHVRALVRLHEAHDWPALVPSGEVPDEPERYFPTGFAAFGHDQVAEDAAMLPAAAFVLLHVPPDQRQAESYDEVHTLHECRDGRFCLTDGREVTQVPIDWACWFYGVLPDRLQEVTSPDGFVVLNRARDVLVGATRTQLEAA